MARIGMPPSVTVRPMPNIVQITPCPANIISSPTSRYRMANPRGKIQCCSCLHIDFIRRTPGILKIFEALIGVICQFLLLTYGAKHSQVLNESYTLFLITISSGLTTTLLLLGCYLLSRNTYHLIRSSIFEVAFNSVVCLLNASSSAYLAYAVTNKLYDDYTRIPYFQAYPALSGAYIGGFVLSLIHGLDAYLSYMYSQGL